MSTITLENVRACSDITMKVRLKDNGVAVDWSGLTDIKALVYSDDQKAVAGRCAVSVDSEDPTVLVCLYAATKPQYLGVNSIIVRAKYMGREKTYDKQAVNIVARTAELEGEQVVLEDPEVTVDIEVTEVDSSILDAAIAAAFAAADKANEAAEQIPLQVLTEAREATAAANTAAAAANAAGITSVQASIADNEPGTPSVDVVLLNKVLSLVFHHLKGLKGDTGATPNIKVGTVTTGEPGTSVIVEMTGTAEDPVLNITIPQGAKGAQGDTGVSADYPIAIVNNLTTNDPASALSAAQGVVLDGKISQLQQNLVGANITQNENPGTVNSIWIDNGGVIGTGPSGAGMYRADKVAVTAGRKVSLSTTGASYGTTPAAFFCDDNGNIIQTIARAGTATTFNGECPAGATYIYVNYMTTYALSVEGSIPKMSEQLDTLGNNVSENEKDIEALSTYVSKDYSDQPKTLASRWINDNGVVSFGSSSMYARYAPIPVREGVEITYTAGAETSGNTLFMIADANGNVLVHRTSASATIVAPENSAYAYINSDPPVYSCVVKSRRDVEVDAELDELGKDVSNIIASIGGDYANQPKTLASRWINDNGVVSFDSSSYYARYEPIPVKEGMSVVYSAGPARGGNILLMFGDADGNVLFQTANPSGEITVPAGAAYAYINSDPLVFSCVIKSIAETDIAKYAAIGAGAEASIPMIESDFESGDISWQDGSPETSSVAIMNTNLFSVFGGAKTTYHTDNGYRVKFAFYRDNGTFLEVRQWFSGDGFIYMPLSARRMRVVLASPSGASYGPVFADAGLTISVNPSAEYKRAADNEKLYLPIYAPSPQLPANGSEGSDFNAETLTPSELDTAFASLLATYPTPSESNYIQPKYGLRTSFVGRDATDTYDIFSYQFGKKNRYAWKAANPLYAWKNGSTIIYTDSISPRIGDAVYTSSARATSGATVGSFNSTTQQVVVSGTTYDRANDSNVATDVLYSQTPQRNAAGDRDLYDRNDALVGTGTAIDTSNLSYNGKTYGRCEELDYHTDQKMTIVLWGNEHGPQSDPAEPAIILYRLAKYLLGTCRNNDFISFLKNYCNVVLIPCANPYGLQNHTRTNGRGVNLNRNYCTPGWASQSDSDKGSYAGDQSETQFIMNTVAYFVANVAIDIHCLGYVNAVSQGKTHYEGFIPSAELNSGIYEIMRSLSFTYTNYGDPEPLTAAKGSDWLNYIGVSGGLIEMNAGFAEGNGPQHTAEIMEVDFTLLLNTLRLWIYGYNPGIDFSKVAIR